MSKLGLAAIAANATLNEMQRQKEIDYGNATRESDLALLPEREASQRSGYQLQAAQNASSLSLIPAATENKALRFQGDTADRQFDESTRQQREDMERQKLTGQQERLPLQLDTLSKATSESNIKAGLGLDSAKADQRNAPQVQGNKDYAQHTETVKSLAQAVAQRDGRGAVKLINGIMKATNQALPDAVEVVLIPHPNDPKDRLVVALDANGDRIGDVGVSESHLKALANQSKMTTIKPGETMVQVSPNGVTPVYTAPDPIGRSSRMGPQERDVEFYQRVYGVGQAAALDMINNKKMKPRAEFILDSMTAKMKDGVTKPTAEDEREAGEMYDRVMTTSRPTTNTSKPASAAKSGINFRGFMN